MAKRKWIRASMEDPQGGSLMTFEERLDQMEIAIHKPSFHKDRGRANEVNYWVFDYPPQKELGFYGFCGKYQPKCGCAFEDFQSV